MKLHPIVPILILAPLLTLLATNGCFSFRPPAQSFQQADAGFDNESRWQEYNTYQQEVCAKATLKAAKKAHETNRTVLMAVYKSCLLKLDVFI